MRVSSNPMCDINDYLTPEEVDIIVEHMDSLKRKVLVRLLHKTGRRISEVVGDRDTNSPGILLRDINFKDNLISFVILKKEPTRERGLSRKERIWRRRELQPFRKVLPVNPDIINSLRIICKDKKPSDRVFEISRRRVDQILKKAAKDGGLNRNVHAHQFRHSFAVEIAKRSNNPIDLKNLSELLGHSDINMTMTYLRFAPNSPLRDLVK